MALSCGDSHDQTLEIVNRDGRHWVVQFKDFLPEKNIQNVGTPVGGLFPIQWTNHDDFLYFSSFIGGDSQGLCFNNSGSFGLYRINLKDGTTSTTLPLNPSGYAYEFTFSPGGRRLAYIYPEYFIFDWFSGQLTTVTPTPEPH